MRGGGDGELARVGGVDGRECVLDRLTPKQNRTIPPLRPRWPHMLQAPATPARDLTPPAPAARQPPVSSRLRSGLRPARAIRWERVAEPRRRRHARRAA